MDDGGRRLAAKAGVLVVIGLIAGGVLAALLKAVQLTTGNEAHILLYNLDYMPVLKQWNSVGGAGIAFHYATCVLSVLILFFLLRPFHLQFRIFPYVLVYGGGGGILYFLSALTPKLPELGDFTAWFFWTAGHAVFGVVSGGLIRLF